jgi:hypothetical protein
MWFVLLAWLVLVNSTCTGRQLQQHSANDSVAPAVTASYTDLWTAVQT